MSMLRTPELVLMALISSQRPMEIHQVSQMVEQPDVLIDGYLYRFTGTYSPIQLIYPGISDPKQS